MNGEGSGRISSGSLEVQLYQYIQGHERREVRTEMSLPNNVKLEHLVAVCDNGGVRVYMGGTELLRPGLLISSWK
jgi:hypothetical protein